MRELIELKRWRIRLFRAYWNYRFCRWRYRRAERQGERIVQAYEDSIERFHDADVAWNEYHDKTLDNRTDMGQDSETT